MHKDKDAPQPFSDNNIFKCRKGKWWWNEKGRFTSWPL